MVAARAGDAWVTTSAAPVASSAPAAHVARSRFREDMAGPFWGLGKDRGGAGGAPPRSGFYAYRRMSARLHQLPLLPVFVTRT
ncbi:hypothetical protein GCM10009827_089940 [Dactylosporangium maewongense]|uniref:Uncharacterized protein n=1 Tax=Dactylosporangium maewongense TaxID=634393 RepID=A0ABN2CCQ6_9ACTN